MAGNNTYDAGSISVLEGLEAVRKRPGMYIGSVSTKGLNHLIYEIVDNSVDEHLAGFCTEIRVVLEKDGTATVTDNGRGIPVDMHQKGIPLPFYQFLCCRCRLFRHRISVQNPARCSSAGIVHHFIIR